MNDDGCGGRPAARALTPCGRTRREFLWEAGGGFVGTALTALLAGDGFFPGLANASEADTSPDSPLAPKPPRFPAKAKACIVLFMYGGVSQVDTFDPKPELIKRNGKPIPLLDSDPVLKARNPGMLLGSTRKFARCGQAGIEVSEGPCPRFARHDLAPDGQGPYAFDILPRWPRHAADRRPRAGRSGAAGLIRG